MKNKKWYFLTLLIIPLFLVNMYGLNLNAFHTNKYDKLSSLIKKDKLEEFKKEIGKSNVNKYYKSNSNLLLVSVLYNKPKFVDYLISKGINLERKVSRYNSTVLHEAIRSGKIKIINKLIKKSKNLNIQDKYGQTTLHVSSHLAYDNIINLLIQKGINKSIKDINGKTAYDIAKANFEINKSTLRKLKVENSDSEDEKKEVNKYHDRKVLTVEEAVNAKTVDISFTHMETENHNEKNIRHPDNDVIKIGK